ncbi:MAG: hypothetical protein RI973_1167 [Bacteroidota bacterium]|jgi:serine protease Do
MQEIIEKFRKAVIQIATPFTTGTGFYLQEPGLIITNEHVVHGNREVVIEGELFPRQLSRVLYLDAVYDLAFLEAPKAELPRVELSGVAALQAGDRIVAMGHPFGLKFTATQGIISNPNHEENGIRYIQHDAALNPGNSGGPLVDEKGKVVGVNTFIINPAENMGFSLFAAYLDECLKAYDPAKGDTASRCANCRNVVFERELAKNFCPYCGATIELPAGVTPYEPAGIARTLEEILTRCGHDVRLARLGPNLWEIRQGSAKTIISYYEAGGLIAADTVLCSLSGKDMLPAYEFLLRQNQKLEFLSLSVQALDVVLSLEIFDRHLLPETGYSMFKSLFETADALDDLLVANYGAHFPPGRS